MYQSIPPTPSTPPPPRGQTPRMGILELSNPPGWGRKQMANAPSSVNTATVFIDRTVKYYHFKNFNVRFFVSINVFLCNSTEDSN